jgi:uncharacterized protein DUF5989
MRDTRRSTRNMRGGGDVLDSTRDARVSASRGSGMSRPAVVSLLAELWAFMRVRKKWWLGPIVVVLALFGALIVFSQGSAIAPFVYTLF